MRVGVHSESVVTDAEIYKRLLAGVLGIEIEMVTGLAHRGGFENVRRDLHVVLAEFLQKRIELAVVALDNNAQLAHEGSHTSDYVHECRRCALQALAGQAIAQLPAPLALAVAVPRPAIEAWLVAAGEPDFVDPEGRNTGDLKYRLYRSKGARKQRVAEVGFPLAERLGNDVEVRERVARVCPSFRYFLESLREARAQ